jgi:hypothetical protein
MFARFIRSGDVLNGLKPQNIPCQKSVESCDLQAKPGNSAQPAERFVISVQDAYAVP